VAANVGVVRVVFDADGRPLLDSLIVGGRHDGLVAQYVCPYLA